VNPMWKQIGLSRLPLSSFFTLTSLLLSPPVRRLARVGVHRHSSSRSSNVIYTRNSLSDVVIVGRNRKGTANERVIIDSAIRVGLVTLQL